MQDVSGIKQPFFEQPWGQQRCRCAAAARRSQRDLCSGGPPSLFCCWSHGAAAAYCASGRCMEMEFHLPLARPSVLSASAGRTCINIMPGYGPPDHQAFTNARGMGALWPQPQLGLYLQKIASLVIPRAVHLTIKTHKIIMMMLQAVAHRNPLQLTLQAAKRLLA